MKKRILYLSAHEILEHDDIYVFNQLGYDIFPVGHYSRPKTPIKSGRDKMKGKIWEEGEKLFDYYFDYQRWSDKLSGIVCGGGNPYLFKLNKEFVNNFDLVIINCYEENLTINWEAIKHKPVVLRTISQGISHLSPYRENVKVVFMSEKEGVIRKLEPHAVIRQCVDTDYYNGWNRQNNYVLTVNKWLKKRGIVSCYDGYEYVTKNFRRLVIGANNEDIPGALSDISEKEIQGYRSSCGVYFSLCSKPGCVTYSFIEALSTGIPVVSVGVHLGSVNSEMVTFNVDKFIKNGVNGFYSDDLNELIQYIDLILDDENLGKKIGQAGRKTAIEYFSYDRCISDWSKFLKEHVI